MRKTVFVVVIAAITAAGLAGCGKKSAEDGKQLRLKVEEGGVNGGLHPSGRPEAPFIDPQKKSVEVLAAPTAPHLVAREQAKLEAERGKVEAQIHDLMDSYTSNLHDPKNKEKYQQQITQQLETYKRQTLHLFKLQRQADAAAASSDAETN